MIDLSKEEKKYYIMRDGVQEGPFPLSQLAEKGVRPSTYVWADGMEDWEKAEDVADICRLFRNRLHDLMHPDSVKAELERASDTASSPSETPSGGFTRFDPHLDSGDQLPTLEEIEAREDHTVPPPSLIFPSVLIALLFSPIIGMIGVFYAVRSRRAWDKGEKDKAYNYCRLAKMWMGITLFVGLIIAAFVFRHLL